MGTLIEEQVLSYCILKRSADLILDNGIDRSFFFNYGKLYDYIMEYNDRYGNTPTSDIVQEHLNDIKTLLENNPDNKDVADREEYQQISMFSLRTDADTYTEKYLVDTIYNEKAQEDFLKDDYRKFVNLVTVGEVKNGFEYVIDAANKALKTISSIQSDDSVSLKRTAFKRYETYIENCKSDIPYMYGTGFKELDDLIGGLRRSEELAVIYARTGNCKSWVLNKILQYNYHVGRTVGVFSPEMSAETYGYRTDTLNGNFDNFSITSGRKMSDEEIERYKAYALAESTKQGADYLFCNPGTFQNRTTVSALKRWVQKNSIELLGIDGISYMVDERARRGDNRTTQLTHIAEDLMTMSIELKMPIVVVAQANRTGVSENTPELDSIRDSDGISHNATLAISSKMSSDVLTLKITKNRYGKVGEKVRYKYDVNYGKFEATYMDDSETFADLPVKDHGVRSKQPLVKQSGSDLHPF